MITKLPFPKNSMINQALTLSSIKFNSSLIKFNQEVSLRKNYLLNQYFLHENCNKIYSYYRLTTFNTKFEEKIVVNNSWLTYQSKIYYGSFYYQDYQLINQYKFYQYLTPNEIINFPVPMLVKSSCLKFIT